MQCGNQEAEQLPSERGDGESPLCEPVSSHFQAARDDRDGYSRYRVTKMPIFGELGWYRERLAPMLGERFIFFMEVINQYE